MALNDSQKSASNVNDFLKKITQNISTSQAVNANEYKEQFSTSIKNLGNTGLMTDTSVFNGYIKKLKDLEDAIIYEYKLKGV